MCENYEARTKDYIKSIMVLGDTMILLMGKLLFRMIGYVGSCNTKILNCVFSISGFLGIWKVCISVKLLSTRMEGQKGKGKRMANYEDESGRGTQSQ